MDFSPTDTVELVQLAKKFSAFSYVYMIEIQKYAISIYCIMSEIRSDGGGSVVVPESGSSRVSEDSSLRSQLHHRVEESGVDEEEQVGIEARHNL